MQNVNKIVLPALLFPAPKFCAKRLSSYLSLQLYLKVKPLLRHDRYKLLYGALMFPTEALNTRQCQHQSGRPAAGPPWPALRSGQSRVVPRGLRDPRPEGGQGTLPAPHAGRTARTGEKPTQGMDPAGIQILWLQAIKFRIGFSMARGRSLWRSPRSRRRQQSPGGSCVGLGTGTCGITGGKLGPFSSPRVPGDAISTCEQPVLMPIISKCIQTCQSPVRSGLRWLTRWPIPGILLLQQGGCG